MRYDAAVIKSIPSSSSPRPAAPLAGQYAPTVFNWKNFPANFLVGCNSRRSRCSLAATVRRLKDHTPLLLLSSCVFLNPRRCYDRQMMETRWITRLRKRDGVELVNCEESKVKVQISEHVSNLRHSYCLNFYIRIFKFPTHNTYIFIVWLLKKIYIFIYWIYFLR